MHTMSAQSPEEAGLAVALARRAETGEDSTAIAGALAAAWVEIDAILAPVLSKRGIAALYQRSLYLTGRAHPWLVLERQSFPTDIDVGALQALLALQPSSAAARGGAAHLQSFRGMLGGLIGQSLTERLLRPVWSRLSDEKAMPEDP